MNQLWEILVPRNFNSGIEIPLRHHQQWDNYVRKLAGGLTIFRSAKGEWTNLNGEVFREKMIPVRVACAEEPLKQIIDFTISHYDQEAVMAYRISDKVMIVHK